MVFVLRLKIILGCDIMKCKLCDEEIKGHGHYLSKGGYCCDVCNWTKVLPARMKGEHL